MNPRIQRLIKFIQNNDYPNGDTIELDPFDDMLAEPVMVAKRLTDYMLAQKVWLHEDAELIGIINFNRSPVPADIFPRSGHANFSKICQKYYMKPQENLATFEWQHSNPDFGKVIRLGLNGYIEEINRSRMAHLGEVEHLNFLSGLEVFISGMKQKMEQYRAFCVAESEKTSDPERRKTLRRIAANVERVPMFPARTFEEAIQCVYICWHCLSDSIGRPDQYLYPLYKHDIESGILTREHAIELLQEFFITIHRHTCRASGNDTKGAESHFVVGGYTIDHEDGFNDLSELILEAMMDMPLIRPQVSLRWTKKTPRRVLHLMMDHERKDPFKRIAFANDEPRIRSMMEILGFPWEVAFDYIVVGCNEPAFQGGISLGGTTVNILRCMTKVFTDRKVEVLECKTFDEFYALWEKCLFYDLELILSYENRFNVLRSKDCNVMSSLFLHGCIERAESATRGGAALARCGFNFMGGTNLIDSLCIIKQFVFEEKRVSMADMVSALEKDWAGYEELRLQILRDGRFFGNNDDFSNSMMQRFNRSLYAFAMGRKEHFGNQLMFGNLTGYHPHFAWFGAQTGATPDGRVAGAALTFGSGQAAGKDRDGASSHLLSVAQMDPTGIMCGNTIMNLTMEKETVENGESFEKFVSLVETYFQSGGLHIQLNYISREELLDAQKNPDNYKSLRVRVSGFSAYFTGLQEELQDNVIARTSNQI